MLGNGDNVYKFELRKRLKCLVKAKVKLFICLITHNAMKAHGGVVV